VAGGSTIPRPVAARRLRATGCDIAQYKDRHTELLTQLVEAKVAGKEIVAPPAVEHAQVLNLNVLALPEDNDLAVNDRSSCNTTPLAPIEAQCGGVNT
jgi:hypothetical protein